MVMFEKTLKKSYVIYYTFENVCAKFYDDLLSKFTRERVTNKQCHNIIYKIRKFGFKELLTFDVFRIPQKYIYKQVAPGNERQK